MTARYLAVQALMRRYSHSLSYVVTSDGTGLSDSGSTGPAAEEDNDEQA